MSLRIVIVGVTCAFACVVGAPAQTGQGAPLHQGAVHGAVRDPFGVIPGAEVTLIHDDTKSERSVMTNAAGRYAFKKLQPGTYTVRVALPGFKAEERTHVRVATRPPALVDFILEVTAVAHEIPEES